MKKKLLSILLVAVLTLSLAACGSSGNSGKGKDKKNSSSSEEEVTLSVMVTTRPTTDAKDFYLDWLPELVKEKYPNINIEVEQLPTDQYKQTVRLKFASGQGPDIFTWWPALQAKDLVEAGYVRDMSDFSQLDKFNPDITNSYEFDGKTYAIPLGTSFLTTWYNKDMFEDAGVAEIPQNWDEFLNACEKLKDAGYTPIAAGDKQSFVIQFGMYQIGASQIYSENPNFDDQLFTGETKFTDECWEETVAKFEELYTKGYVIDNSLGLSQEQSRQAYVDGKAAMIFDGSFGYDALNKDGAVPFEKGMFAIPSNEAGNELVYNLTPSNGLFVSADSEKQEAIDKVLDYWFTEGTPLFEKWTTTTSDISCYEGVEDSRELIKEYLESYKDNQSIYNLNNAWPEGVSDTMCTKFQEVITQNASAADVCQAMQDKFEELNK
ncbi:ABC transporter substrate-binding protein [Clostridium sp. C105KSO13]|uniref:ABC transporter substrate-binding protein n=1 Tax=Clostridium sp. C105KSO13 TaxID=1776045 RepID=UPI0007406B1A|nr:extracellular solute-binding protein [Clostridium sp. C105KSO13]CUX17411.1 Multiple sugar-binding protein precursor [Clostridium sp. C105KSO13]